MRTIASTSAVPANAQHASHGFWSRTLVIQLAPQRLRQSRAAGGAPASPGSFCVSPSSLSTPARRSRRGEKLCLNTSRGSSPTSARRAVTKTLALTPSLLRSTVVGEFAGRRPSSDAPRWYMGSNASSSMCADGCQPSCSLSMSRRRSPKVMAIAFLLRVRRTVSVQIVALQGESRFRQTWRS